MGTLAARQTLEFESQTQPRYRPSSAAATSGSPPVHRLPPELLSQVFLRVSFGTRRALIGPSHPAQQLASVCQYWRELALLTPGLWSSFTLLWTSGLQDRNVFSTAMERWVSRSGTSALSILFDYSAAPAQQSDDLTLYVHLLHLTSARCREVEIKAPGAFFYHIFSVLPRREIPTSFPRLEEFVISGVSFEIDFRLRGNLGQLNTPRLRRLRFHYAPIFLSTVPLKFNLSTIQELSLMHRPLMPAPFDIHDAVALISKCERLVKCSVSITPGGSRPDTVHCTLSHLAEVDIICYVGILYGDILDLFTLPALQKLRLEQPQNRNGMRKVWPAVAFGQMLRRSKISAPFSVQHAKRESTAVRS